MEHLGEEAAAGVEDTEDEDCIQVQEIEQGALLLGRKEVEQMEVRMNHCPCCPWLMQNLPYLPWLVSCTWIFGSGTKSLLESVLVPEHWPAPLFQAAPDTGFAGILFLIVVFVRWSRLFWDFSLSSHCASLVFLPPWAVLHSPFQMKGIETFQNMGILELVLFGAED